MVEAGSASGLSDLANFDTGNTATSLTVQQVPNGIYFVRVRARNLTGASDPSNEITLTVGTSAPGAPAGLTNTVSGSSVTLAWNAAAGGCAATSYVLQAGSSAGASNLANFNTGSTAVSYVATGVAAGTYYIRVVAANGSGVGAPSNEIIVTVGSGTPGRVTTYTGPYSGQMVETTVSTSLTGGGSQTCVNTYTMSGTMSMRLEQSGNILSGSATVTGTQRETGVSGGCNSKRDEAIDWSPTILASPSDLRFSAERVEANGYYTVTNRPSFAGALSGGVVTGTLSFSVAGSGTNIERITSITQNGSSIISVTLR